MRYDIHTLGNGLRVVLIPMKDNQTASVIVMAGTGSRYETERENGLAHFLEHMFFKGTKKRPSAREISEELDALGSSYNAFTSKERTAYYAKVSREFIMEAIDVVSDIYLNSTLPAREITKERGAVIQEIDMYEDMPMRTVDNVFDALIFGSDHPLGRTILGPKENIRAFKRKDFESYLRRHYTAANTVVVVAGAFDENAVLAKLEHDFASLRAGEKAAHEPISISQKGSRVSIKDKKTDQTQFMLGVPAYPYNHADEYALSVLATILGGGMSSRLFMEVREKRGLAYSVHASIEKYPDVGYFYAQAGVEHAKLGKAITTSLAEFKKIKRAPVAHAELKKAKAYLKGNMTLRLETTDELAESIATSLVNLGRVRTLEERLERIEAVTAEDVQRVARDILRTEALNLAVIGPHRGKDAALASLLRC